jgi:hypothetical protein
VTVTPPEEVPQVDYRTTPTVAAGAAGSLVAQLIGGVRHETSGAWFRGVAVVSLTGTAAGAWQFSLDGGRTWRDFGAAYRGRARLLRETDRVRFVPRGPLAGMARLLYHGWDQANGVAGATVNLARHGATGANTPFGGKTLAAELASERAAPAA